MKNSVTAKIVLFLILNVLINNFIKVDLSLGVEYLSDEQTAPDSVEGLRSPMGETFKIIPRKKVLFPLFKDLLDKLPSFFSGTQANLKIRSYYFDRTNSDDSQNTALALGGSIFIESGKLFNLMSIGGELFTSQRIYGPKDKDGTLLLGPGQEGFTVLGTAYGQLNYEDKITIKLYRQYANTPYVNKQDSRMVPNTFEAYSLRANLGVVQFGGGYIAKIKRRNSEKFVPMSQIGSIDNKDSGMFVFGAVFYPREGFAIGGINYFVGDVIKIFYAESTFVKTTDSGLGVKVSAQATDQRSVGKELLGPQFSTQVWGGQVAASYLNTILRFAFSATSSDKEIISPWGGYPGYLSLMEEDFNRAGENAYLIGLSHDLKSLRLEGLSFFANYALGYDAVDAVERDPIPDQREFDITVDYKPKKVRPLGQVWFRFRYANVNISNEDSVHDVRVIFNYNLPLL